MIQNISQEVTYPLPQPQPLRLLAKIVSYLFHPLFIPVYIAAYLIYGHPYFFDTYDDKQKLIRLISIAVISTFFPAFTVFLLWRLKFADSIFLHTQKERIVPYITSTMYYFWAFYVNKNLPGTPPAIVFFFLGLFFCVSLAVIFNNYFKISMHGQGVGGAVAFIILLGLTTDEPIGLAISLTTLIGGLVCTSRLIISDHHPMEVYTGVILGAICQLVACYFIM
ncbi:MAG: hypothetical protein JWQ96_824 [Segetibacter sp.]|nr:hypothetical protein [Segetibacter sp.]